MVKEPQTVFSVTRKRVPEVRNVFSFEKTTVFGIETVVWVIQTVLTRTGTTVMIAQKTVSFA